MRKRSLSVAYERANKVEELSKKFEGVPADPEDGTESEEENEDELQVIVGNADWSMADYNKLLEQLRSVLPRKDTKKYLNTLSKIPWENVAFDGHTPEDVRTTTEALIQKVRKFRTLTEMLGDVANVAATITASNKPKKPNSAYNLFVKDRYSAVRAKYPDTPSGEVFKLLSQEFSALSEKKKRKYEAAAVESKEQYKKELEQYYVDHPEEVADKKPSKNGKKSKTPKQITPFNMFRAEKKQEMKQVTNIALRKLWEDLDLKKRIKYIQQAFQKQSDDGPKLKLTKAEKDLMYVALGKPEPIARTPSEYYLKHYAQPIPDCSVLEWRKYKMAEYRALPKVRRLQLEIEFRHAKQEYVTKYQEYITSLKDETVRREEIEQLKSFITTKLDKEEKNELDNRPFHSLLESSNPHYHTLPIAESTLLKSAKTKSKPSKKDAFVPPAPVASSASANLGSPIVKPVKSILKSPASKRPLSEGEPDVVEASPKRKKKVSVAESETDSNSEKKPIVVPEMLADSKTKSKKKEKANGNQIDEPIRPPGTLLEYYRKFHYLGKAAKCEESFKNLSTNRKQAIKKEMREATKKYFKQLQKFLKQVPKENIESYLKKLKKTEIQYLQGVNTDDDSADEETSKTVPKVEPASSISSTSSSSSDEDEEEETVTTATTASTNGGKNGNDNDDDDDDDDDDSSDDE